MCEPRTRFAPGSSTARAERSFRHLSHLSAPSSTVESYAPGLLASRSPLAGFPAYYWLRLTSDAPECPSGVRHQISRGKTPVTFLPSTRRIYMATSRMTFGIGVLRHLAQVSMPRMRFVFLGPEVRLQLPSDAPSRGSPLLFGSEFPSSRPPEDSHLLVTSRLGFPHRFSSYVLHARRFAPCPAHVGWAWAHLSVSFSRVWRCTPVHGRGRRGHRTSWNATNPSRALKVGPGPPYAGPPNNAGLLGPPSVSFTRVWRRTSVHGRIRRSCRTSFNATSTLRILKVLSCLLSKTERSR